MGIGTRIWTAARAFELPVRPTTLTPPLTRPLHSPLKRCQGTLQTPRTVPSSAMTSYTQAPIASATAHTGKLASIDLSGYDFEQAKLMDERCIVVDENDNPLGALDKKTCRSLR